MISNREDALGISQDVFLKAYQALGNFKKASQFYSWLHRIAINCCIDFMRRGAERGVVSNDPVSDDAFYHHEAVRHLSSPSNAVDYEEFCLYLQRAVTQLTPKQREVFILHYKEELSLKEIARKMGRSIGTVKAHLFQVRYNLRELLLPYLQNNGF